MVVVGPAPGDRWRNDDGGETVCPTCPVVKFVAQKSGFYTVIVTPKTGIALQNRGACFVTDPKHPNCIGPAKRPLPQLKITVDDEGYLVSAQPFREAVGPSFWERG